MMASTDLAKHVEIEGEKLVALSNETVDENIHPK